MGLLGSVMGALGGAGGNGGGANLLMGIVMQMLSNNGRSGGLAGLAKAFQDKGMGGQMASWIGPARTCRSRPVRSRPCWAAASWG